MELKTTIPVPNAIVLVMDSEVGEVPESMGGESIACTRTCIVVSTLPSIDGPTTIRLSRDVRPGRPAFEGLISTPSRRVSICSTAGEILLEADGLGEQTGVRIWTNDPCVPDMVDVCVAPRDGWG